ANRGGYTLKVAPTLTDNTFVPLELIAGDQAAAGQHTVCALFQSSGITLSSHTAVSGALTSQGVTTTSATVNGPLLTNIGSGQCVQTGANGLLGGTGSACGAGGGGGVTVYAATATASFPFGLTASTITVSSLTLNN